MNGDTPDKSVSDNASERSADSVARQPGVQSSSQPESSWTYVPESSPPQPEIPTTPSPRMMSPEAEVSWSASEFIAHSKGFEWYAALAIITLALDVFLYFWTRDIISIIGVTIMALLFGILAGRKPRTLDYRVDHLGLTIGPKTYPFSVFKSFSIMEEGAFSSITFMPLKRFMPPIAIYYDPKDRDKIVDALSAYLPFEARAHDTVDRMTRRIRF